jgi:hypothetical protein
LKQGRNRRWDGIALRLHPVINILETDDVVLAEVRADLDLDELKRTFAGIGKTMRASEWQVHRLIFLHEAHPIIDRDFRSSVDDDPMLGTVMMLLQR